MTYKITNFTIDGSIWYREPRSKLRKIYDFLIHPIKCTTDLFNLVHKIENGNDVIYADEVCLVCGKSKNILVFSKCIDSNFLVGSSEIIK